MNISSIPLSQLPPQKARNTNAVAKKCSEMPCGEAGCLVDPLSGLPKCVCVPGFREPDEKMMCPRNMTDETIGGLNDHHYNGSKMEILASLNERYHQPGDKTLSPHSGLYPHHHYIIAIATGGAILLLLGLLTIALMLRRHRKCINSRRHAAISNSGAGLAPPRWLMGQENTSLLLDHMTVVGKNPNYLAPEDDLGAFVHDLNAPLIQRENLCLLEDIGEGAFGKVYKGELRLAEDKLSDDKVMNVAVKILKRDASRETKDDFRREVEIMRGFHHKNILKLIGVTRSDEELPCMVFEFMEYGDLAELLRKSDPGGKSRRLNGTTILEVPHLLDIAIQVACGMAYLSSEHFVHRDLATRNCLVGTNLVVKISDFGMSRDIYTCDYYKIGGARMLPIRWMSPEAVKYGKFTSESDVWAYGVVLWEIFCYGKQPYYGHSNEEVIRFIEEGILLPKPDYYFDTVYHVMLGCWRSDPKDRFNFPKIQSHMTDCMTEMLQSLKRADMTSSVQQQAGRNRSFAAVTMV